jgi:hypothetical protein
MSTSNTQQYKIDDLMNKLKIATDERIKAEQERVEAERKLKKEKENFEWWVRILTCTCCDD